MATLASELGYMKAEPETLGEDGIQNGYCAVQSLQRLGAQIDADFLCRMMME